MSSDQGVKKILIVDDEAPIRTLLRDCFELEGYQVTEAADGHTLHERLAESPVHLITLDLNLGGESGLELARQVRARCNVPLVDCSLDTYRS